MVTQAKKARGPSPPSSLNLFLFGVTIFSAVIRRLFTAPFRRDPEKKARTLFKDLSYAAIRTMLKHVTVPQARHMFPSTREAYNDYCKTARVAPRSLSLDGVFAHWIGEKDSDVVIFHIHGGGYTQPAPVGEFQYFDRLVKDVNKSLGGKKTISVLALEYTLAPEAVFPMQLRQAATILNYLLEDFKRDPSDIILAGDSAGGGLLLSLLWHILKPSPQDLGVANVTIQEPFRGVLLYSPWVSFSTSQASFAKNFEKDTMEPSMLRKWACMYLGAVASDTDPVLEKLDDEMVAKAVEISGFAEPIAIAKQLGEGLRIMTQTLLVFAGGDEAFVDDINNFTGELMDGVAGTEETTERVTLVNGWHEAHVGPIMDAMLGYTEKSPSQLAIEEWLLEHLR